MASPLPFLLQPQRQYREIGEPPNTLKIPLYGKIRLRESLVIREQEFTGAFLEEAARLAAAITETQQITDASQADHLALRILSRVLGSAQLQPEPGELAAEAAHRPIIRVAAERLAAIYQTQQIRSITAIIRFRLGVLEWTDAQSVTLDDEVQEAILKLVEDERAAATGGPQDEAEILESLKDSLGKFEEVMGPLPDPPEVPVPETIPTGGTSTGGSVTSGPTTPTPALNASPTSPKRRSLKPSRRASAG